MSEDEASYVDAGLFYMNVLIETAQSFKDLGLTPCQAVTKMRQSNPDLPDLLAEWRSMGLVEDLLGEPWWV